MDDLEQYLNCGKFKFTLNDSLFRVCNAPEYFGGIYLIYALKNTESELIYIGISGRIDKFTKKLIVRKDGINVPEYFEQAILLTADFNKLSAENLWNYPNQIERALEEVINLDSSQSDNPVVKAHLNFEIDDTLLQKYSTEMERLTEFFQQNPELYD